MTNLTNESESSGVGYVADSRYDEEEVYRLKIIALQECYDNVQLQSLRLRERIYNVRKQCRRLQGMKRAALNLLRYHTGTYEIPPLEIVDEDPMPSFLESIQKQQLVTYEAPRKKSKRPFRSKSDSKLTPEEEERAKQRICSIIDSVYSETARKMGDTHRSSFRSNCVNRAALLKSVNVEKKEQRNLFGTVCKSFEEGLLKADKKIDVEKFGDEENRSNVPTMLLSAHSEVINMGNENHEMNTITSYNDSDDELDFSYDGEETSNEPISYRSITTPLFDDALEYDNNVEEVQDDVTVVPDSVNNSFTSSLDAVLQTSSSFSTSLDAVQQPSSSFSTSLDALQQPNNTFSTSLDAVLQPNSSFSTSLGAVQQPNNYNGPSSATSNNSYLGNVEDISVVTDSANNSFSTSLEAVQQPNNYNGPPSTTSNNSYVGNVGDVVFCNSLHSVVENAVVYTNAMMNCANSSVSSKIRSSNENMDPLKLFNYAVVLNAGGHPMMNSTTLDKPQTNYPAHLNMPSLIYQDNVTTTQSKTITVNEESNIPTEVLNMRSEQSVERKTTKASSSSHVKKLPPENGQVKRARQEAPKSTSNGKASDLPLPNYIPYRMITVENPKPVEVLMGGPSSGDEVSSSKQIPPPKRRRKYKYVVESVLDNVPYTFRQAESDDDDEDESNGESSTITKTSLNQNNIL